MGIKIDKIQYTEIIYVQLRWLLDDGRTIANFNKLLGIFKSRTMILL
jgi:hypothetical protein